MSASIQSWTAAACATASALVAGVNLRQHAQARRVCRDHQCWDSIPDYIICEFCLGTGLRDEQLLGRVGKVDLFTFESFVDSEIDRLLNIHVDVVVR